MDPKHRQIIKDNRGVLEKNICLNNNLIRYLKEYKLFNKYMWEDVKTSSDLFDLLPSRGPKAFKNIIEILRKADYDEEADLLEKPILSVEIRDKLFYKMSSTPLGYCLIINNVEFESPKQKMHAEDKLEYRFGSDVDAKSLRDFFEKIGFDVSVKRNLKTNQMIDCIKEFSEKDFQNVDCMVLTILSHGSHLDNKDVIYGTDGNYIFKNDIYKDFSNETCEYLQSKPKIFFFVCCRGKGLDYGVPKSLPNESTDSNMTILPSFSDIFVVHSSLPYQVSIRNHESGSYFCEALMFVLNKYHKMHDLETIIKLVNIKLEGKVSVQYRIVQAAHTENVAWKKKVMFCRRM